MYSGATPSGERRTFGTSGLLYRSNKMMWDRTSYSLWSNLTGEPLIGRLADSGERLEMLPMTLTRWRSWRELHPETTVMILPATYGRRWGYTYAPGLADRAREGVRFPVWRKSEALAREAEVYGLRLGEHAKAYPIEALLSQDLVHDRLGDVEVLLVVDAGSGAVRAYRRLQHTFTRERGGVLVDQRGLRWRVGETALQPIDDDGSASGPLPRLPGHHAWWFGWFGFFPHTEVWEPGAAR